MEYAHGRAGAFVPETAEIRFFRHEKHQKSSQGVRQACPRDPTEGRFVVLGLRHARLVLRGMIEANGAELWAISVSNPLQPLECSRGRWATFFVEVSSGILRGFAEDSVRRLCRCVAILMGPSGSHFFLHVKWPFRRVFTRCPPQWCACWLQAGSAPQADHRPASGRPPAPPPRPTPPEV